MNFTELLGRIKRSFKSHDSSGLLDEQSIYEWYVDSLKPFGALPFEIYEDIIEIKNGTGKLPTGFRKLIVAVKCEPYTYHTEHKKHLQKSVFWKERHEKSVLWDSCSDCCIEESEKYIVEDLYYEGYKSTYYYHRPEIVRLTEGINRKSCDSNCMNFKERGSKFEINIIGNKRVQANFKEGNLLIRYRGYSEDEDGFIEVPETFNGYLALYIENYVKAEVMMSMLSNGDNTGAEQSLLSVYRQDAYNYKSLALTELKANSFSKDTIRSLRNRMRAERRKIDFIL